MVTVYLANFEQAVVIGFPLIQLSYVPANKVCVCTYIHTTILVIKYTSIRYQAKMIVFMVTFKSDYILLFLGI